MMTTTRFAAFVLALALGAGSAIGLAQTQAQQLQKGIFTEETLGDLDGAIQIYREILVARAVSSDIAAQAQTRLAESLRRKGQPQAAPAQAQAAQTGCCGMWSGNYDENRPVTVVGTVTGMQWMNPQSVLFLDGTDGNTWAFTMAPPNALLRAGMTKATIKLGEQVRIDGFLAKGIGDTCPAQLPNACERIPFPPASKAAQATPAGALHANAKFIVFSDGTTIFDRMTVEKEVAGGVGGGVTGFWLGDALFVHEQGTGHVVPVRER